MVHVCSTWSKDTWRNTCIMCHKQMLIDYWWKPRNNGYRATRRKGCCSHNITIICTQAWIGTIALWHHQGIIHMNIIRHLLSSWNKLGFYGIWKKVFNLFVDWLFLHILLGWKTNTLKFPYFSTCIMTTTYFFCISTKERIETFVLMSS